MHLFMVILACNNSPLPVFVHPIDLSVTVDRKPEVEVQRISLSSVMLHALTVVSKEQ